MSKYYKEKNRQAFKEILTEISKYHTVDQLTEYQYRIDGYLDVYPSNMKFHIIPTNERGSFKNLDELKKLLT